MLQVVTLTTILQRLSSLLGAFLATLGGVATKGYGAMGRKVKCQITKEVGLSDEFFKAPNGKYYKTEQIYLHWKHESDDRKKCIELICDYADYRGENYAPTFLNKMIADFGHVFGYGVLLQTIQDCESSFRWANDNKEFKNEFGRLSYYQSIIGNHIADVYKEQERIREQESRIRLTPIEEFVDVDNIGCPTGGGKDLSILLGDV